MQIINANKRSNFTASALLIGLFGTIPGFSATILFQNVLPTTNLNGFPATTSRSNVAPVYGSLPDANLGGSPSRPYILGDQFQLSQDSIISSVTIYEVGNVATTSTGLPGDTPDTEFSNISLYMGADLSPTGLGPAVASLSTPAALLAASAQVCYTALCGSGGTNYQSVNNSSFFAIYSITFSGLNIFMTAGLHDFAIGATPISSNTFALHMSDPSQGPTENSTGIAGHDFLYYFFDGAGSSPLATYQYASGAVTNWTNPGALDVNTIISGTAVPEPATFGLMTLTLGMVLFSRRPRARRLQ